METFLSALKSVWGWIWEAYFRPEVGSLHVVNLVATNLVVANLDVQAFRCHTMFGIEL
jgi:hypothetical protein